MYSVTGEPEPGLSVVWSDLWKQFRDGLIENLTGPCFGRSEELFELGPSLFNRVQIWRIGRQVQQFRSSRLDASAHAVDLVRTQVIHHHHVARAQLRT